ncbi:MAG: hypothetical protein IT303_00610 [Dehalococcoidia bacterium]|nr:hypothetical protein [Dehalococcoidia bacterium]
MLIVRWAASEPCDPWAVLRGESDRYPAQLARHMGHRAYDVVPGSHVTLILISGRLAQFLAENEVTGWATYPVEQLPQFGDRQYSGLIISGRGGDLAPIRTVRMQDPSSREPRLRNVTFHDTPAERWDGSDIFTTTRVSAHIFLSARALELLRGARSLTGFTAMELSEFPYFTA